MKKVIASLFLSALGATALAPAAIAETLEEPPNTVRIHSDEELEAKAAQQRIQERVSQRQGKILLSTEEVEFKTRVMEDDTLPEGVEFTKREGVNGERSYYRSYVETVQADGSTAMIPLKHSELTVVPINEIVVRGTDTTVIQPMSDKAIEREAERERQREAEARAERERQAQAEREAAAEREEQSASSSNNSDSSSQGGSANVDTSATAAEMKAQVAPGQVTTPEQNRAYAKAILSPADFAAADTLVNRESRWITTAANPNSSAYGVPQSLPGNKMASAGSDWRTNGMTQFDWMITYVEQRYGSFQNALAHSTAHGWY